MSKDMNGTYRVEGTDMQVTISGCGEGIDFTISVKIAEKLHAEREREIARSKTGNVPWIYESGRNADEPVENS